MDFSQDVLLINHIHNHHNYATIRQLKQYISQIQFREATYLHLAVAIRVNRLSSAAFVPSLLIAC